MKKTKGFTLIELVVVMALIALLSLLVIGAIVAARRMVTETKHRNNGKAIQVGMEKWYASHKAYPTVANIPADSSFETAKGTLDVQIDDTATENGCKSDSLFYGGGKITYNSNGWIINPYNYNCSTPLGDTYTQPN